MRLMTLARLEAWLSRACYAVRKHRIERTFAQAAANAGIDGSPGSLYDDLTKPTRLELRTLGLPA